MDADIHRVLGCICIESQWICYLACSSDIKKRKDNFMHWDQFWSHFSVAPWVVMVIVAVFVFALVQFVLCARGYSRSLCKTCNSLDKMSDATMDGLETYLRSTVTNEDVTADLHASYAAVAQHGEESEAATNLTSRYFKFMGAFAGVCILCLLLLFLCIK